MDSLYLTSPPLPAVTKGFLGAFFFSSRSSFMLHPVALCSECTFLGVELGTDESSERFQGGSPAPLSSCQPRTSWVNLRGMQECKLFWIYSGTKTENLLLRLVRGSDSSSTRPSKEHDLPCETPRVSQRLLPVQCRSRSQRAFSRSPRWWRDIKASQFWYSQGFISACCWF